MTLDQIRSAGIPVSIFDGRAFVSNPYLASSSLRYDVFCRQLRIVFDCSVEYHEDSGHGTWWSDTRLDFGHAGLITEAIDLTEQRLQDPLSWYRDRHDTDVLDLCVSQVSIYDRSGRLVLSGTPAARQVRWSAPCTSREEIETTRAAVVLLRNEAAIESSWDNYETARQLRRKASLLESKLIDPVWAPHVSTALMRMEVPRLSAR